MNTFTNILYYINENINVIDSSKKTNQKIKIEAEKYCWNCVLRFFIENIKHIFSTID